MTGVSPEEHLRLLQSAEGDPALLGMTAVDLTFPELEHEQRTELRAALVACALPHWFTPMMLADILELDKARSDEIWGQLTRLDVVEMFPARGELAANVHEATRKQLRRHLFREDRERFRLLSRRIASHFDGSGALSSRIERLFHRLVGEPEAGAHELERAMGDWLKDADVRKSVAIDHVLAELLEEGFLTERASLRARLATVARSTGSGRFAMLPEADRYLEEAQALDDPLLVADAYALKAAERVAAMDWAGVWEAATQSGSVYAEIAARDRADYISRSECAFTLSLASSAAASLGRPEQALEIAGEVISIREQLVAELPDHAGHIRELAMAYDDLSRRLIYVDQDESAFHYTGLAVDKMRSLSEAEPDHADLRFDYVVALHQAARLQVALADYGRGLDDLREVISILGELVDLDPSQMLWRLEMGLAWRSMSKASSTLNDLDAARDSVELALTTLEELNRLEPSGISREALVGCYYLAGDIARARGEGLAAEEAYSRASHWASLS